jgi:hypothetical protein
MGSGLTYCYSQGTFGVRLKAPAEAGKGRWGQREAVPLHMTIQHEHRSGCKFKGYDLAIKSLRK